MSIGQNSSGAEPETNARELLPYEPFADRLILLRLGEKKPLKTDWPNERNSFADALEHMKIGLNVGIRLGDGLMVLDWDRKDDPARDDPDNNSLTRLCRDAGIDLSRCAIVETGNGLHVYVRTPPGWHGRERVPAYPGLEFKGAGRQVVCAGSLHPSGRVYRWRQQ